MNLTLITSILSMIEGVLPQIGVNVPVINTIIDTIEQLIPIIAGQFPNLQASIQNIIDTLRGGDQVSDDQKARLDALSAAADSAFEAAAADYDANHPNGDAQ